MNGIENKVDDAIKREGEHFGDVSKQINAVDAKVEKVSSSVHNTWLLGYRFVGKGAEGSSDGSVYMPYKSGSTIKECFEFCQTKRMQDRAEGVVRPGQGDDGVHV